jgi:4-amino-4-deoxy-L-arabinose transferase
MLLAAFSLAFQGSRGLWEPDEGRYTAVAMEMQRTGDYLTPALNSETPHFSKPPLVYWSILAGVALLGHNEWGVRLAGSLAFAGTVLLVWAMARCMLERRAWLAPLAYATFGLPFCAANIVTADTLLTVWMALGMFGFVATHAASGASAHRAPRLLMWLGFGLAFLTKGPPALLPWLAIPFLVVPTRGWRGLRDLFSLGGMTLFSIVGLGWYLLVAWSHPGLLAYFLGDEVWGRMFSAAANRNPQWYGGLHAYGPALLLGSLPWSWSLLRGAWGWCRNRWSEPRPESDPWSPFLAAWLFLPLLVLLICRSRLPLYVLPLFIPLALMVGRQLQDRPFGRWHRWACALWVLGLLVFKGVASQQPHERDARALSAEIRALATPPPDEIVFIDVFPAWGLSFYLDCEVEGVVWATAPSPRAHESLGEELGSVGGRVLFVVRTADVSSVLEIFQLAGRPAEEIGQVQDWTLLASGEDREDGRS